MKISVLIPAYNEEAAIRETLERVRKTLAEASPDSEVLVIDDGSSDGTGRLAESVGGGVRVLRHPTNAGYGRALKTGLRTATADWIAILDADGSYPIEELPKLLAQIPAFDMVVGARQGSYYQGSGFKWLGRRALERLVHFVAGVWVPDVNSGLRIFRKSVALGNLDRFSNGFSFTTTLTLAMFAQGYFVKYIPVAYSARVGNSKVRIGRDTLRTMQLLVMAILSYNPIKLFLALDILVLAIGSACIVIDLLVASGTSLALLLAGTSFTCIVLFGLGLVCDLLRRLPAGRPG